MVLGFLKKDFLIESFFVFFDLFFNGRMILFKKNVCLGVFFMLVLVLFFWFGFMFFLMVGVGGVMSIFWKCLFVFFSF